MTKRRRRNEGSAPAPEPQVTVATAEDPGAASGWRASGGFPWPPIVLITLVVGVSLLVVTIRASTSEAGADPRTMEDVAYVAAINTACREAFPDLRPKTTAREDLVGTKEAAEGVLRAAEGIERLAATVRTLPGPAADQARVATWLGDWDQYVAVGRTYSDVVRTGDVERADAIGRTGDAAQKRADRFARGNGLTDCTFAVRFKAPPRRPGSL